MLVWFTGSSKILAQLSESKDVKEIRETKKNEKKNVDTRREE